MTTPHDAPGVATPTTPSTAPTTARVTARTLLRALGAAALCLAALTPKTALAQSVLLAPASSCVHDSPRTVVVRIDLASAPPTPTPVVGGQFFLEYDDSILTLVSAAPGAGTATPPFDLEVYSATPGPGLIDYAVGVPGNGPGVLAGTLATLTFHANQDVCATGPSLVRFRAHYPPTRLTDDLGNQVPAATFDLPSIRIDATPPVVTCPPMVIVHTPPNSVTTTPASTILGPGWALEGDSSLTDAGIGTAVGGNDLAVFMDAHDFNHAAAVKYTPPPTTVLLFNALASLSADFNMQCGRFGCGSPHFRIRIDADGNGADTLGDKTLRVVWGTHPTFDDCPVYGAWNSTGNLINSATPRYDTSEFAGGASFDTYTHALALAGNKRVLSVSMVVNETCSAASCTASCGTTLGGRTLLLDNMDVNGIVQRFESATATDNCGPPFPPTSPVITAHRSDGHALTDVYPTGTTHVTFTATDSCGNTSACTQDVVVVGPCGSRDFNCDGDIGTDLDIEIFFACLAGSYCPPPPCTSVADFNGDGDIGTDLDIEAFFRVLAGGGC